MGGNRLTNLGNAIEGTDAINLSQLINSLANVVAVCNSFTAGASITKHTIVYMGVDERVYVASSDEIDQMHRVIGISKTSANIGASVSVVMFGIVDGFAGLSAGMPYFFDTNGNLSHIPPTIGYTQCLGTAIGSSKIHVNIQVPIGI